MAVQTQILHRRDTAANWTSTNPVLGAGELGFETNTTKFKIGDGTTAWASLNYYVSSASPALTGTPTAPTASTGTNTTQLATTAFVTTADNLKANLSGASFTGVITNSATPSFNAYHSPSGNAGSGIQIFSVVHTNRGSCYNSSNGRFTASVAGNYLFVSSLLSINSGIINGELQKNGVLHQYSESTRGSGTGGYVQAVFCSVMNMAVGDYAQINTGGYAVYGYSYSSFSGFLIG